MIEDGIEYQLSSKDAGLCSVYACYYDENDNFISSKGVKGQQPSGIEQTFITYRIANVEGAKYFKLRVSTAPDAENSRDSMLAKLILRKAF